MFGQTNEAAPEGSNELIKDTTTAGFRDDVLAESMRQPVLVDFWAPWCGPCKQMTPTIEKVIKAAGGKVKLAKMNIDEHPQIAGQLGIKSIPAVIAFQNGRPVDGFTGALPESEIRNFIERIAGPVEGELDSVLATAEAAFEDGQYEEAAKIFSAVLQEDPTHIPAGAGLARALLHLGRAGDAKHVLASLPESSAKDPAIQAVQASVDLALQAAELGDVSDFERKLAVNPDDHDARFDLALALNARGERTSAADALLYIIKKQRDWQDGKARQQLLQFFESWGAMEQDTLDARRKLSTLLFS